MPVTAPPRNATSSAGPSPPRAASATRALERTDTFMPMNPADAEASPPIRKPIATSMFCSGISAMNRTTPTMAIVRYWRFRYAEAPSWIAAERPRMTSLPGDRARSARLVTRPYPTAASAQMSATTTPWSARKSDKGTLSESVQTNTKAAARTRAAAEAARSLSSAQAATRHRAHAKPRPGLLARDPEPSGALGGPGTFGRLLGFLGRGRLGRPALRRRAAGLLRVDHLEPRERVADRPELLGVARLEQRHERASALDRLADLLPVGRRALARRRAQAGLAGGQVQQRDRCL